MDDTDISISIDILRQWASGHSWITIYFGANLIVADFRGSPRDLEHAADFWAAAAGAEGAFFPPHFAAACTDAEPSADIMSLIMAASRAAMVQHDDLDLPESTRPRGVSVRIRNGHFDGLVWDTAGHKILLEAVRDGYVVRLYALREGGLSASRRVSALMDAYPAATG